MKKSRLLIAVLVMLVASSGYAQDTYREAVKDYLTATDQFEKTKSLMSDMRMLYVKNGQVDIDQLTKRYIDEQLENDMLDTYVSALADAGMTEADLGEIISLISAPEGKTFEAHQQEWMGEFVAEFMMPFMMLGEDEEQADDKDWSSGGLADLLGQPVQPRADIDPAYAARFKDVILDSPFTKNMLDAMMTRMDEDATDYLNKKEARGAFDNWVIPSASALLLNSAYGILTLEDLDYAAMLYSNESYCKLANYSNFDRDDLKIGSYMLKYMDWMKGQGATLSEDPQDAIEFLKSMLNLGKLNLGK